MIGREVSIKASEPRRRLRGYIAERVGNKYLICLYPPRGSLSSKFEERTLKTGDFRVLKTAPAGWRAIDVEKPDGKLWFSMRVKPEFIRSLQSLARANDWDFSTAFNALVSQGLESAFKKLPLKPLG